MFPKIDPTTTSSWQALVEHSVDMKGLHLRDLFAKDKERFSAYSFELPDMLIDFSKT